MSGTNSDDLIFFSGQVMQLSLSLTNPYSSKEYFIEDEYLVNDTSYDGFAGFDNMLFTDFGDFLSIRNDNNIQVLFNIERFVAGSGGDVINLADAEIEYGDIQLFGGPSNDILWSNVGNDFVDGAAGDDILDGGPGNDQLFGGSGHDQLFGGFGNDVLLGQHGDDIIYGGTDLGLRDFDQEFLDNVSFPELKEGTNIAELVPPGTPALGIDNDNLTLEFDGTATLTFRQGFAGYNNTLGIYRIAEDGTIENASILWTNVKDAGFDVAHTIDLPLLENGGELGFFIIANGDRKNKGYDDLEDITGEGNIRFVYDFGGTDERGATVTDDGSMVSAVYDDGITVNELKGYDYHTTPRDGDNSINGDGKTHAVSGSVEEFGSQVLRIGFEDLPNLGDADFEDVLFDLDIDRIRVDASEQGADTLNGGAGNDVLYGEGGDDLFILGIGNDDIYGGTGNDIFRYEEFEDSVDRLFDFEEGVDGDVIHLGFVLSFNSEVDETIGDFVKLTDDGDNTILEINQDGRGTDFTALVNIIGGVDGTVEDLFNNGNLILE